MQKKYIMISLLNKTQEELATLIQKYFNLIEHTNAREDFVNLAYTLDVGISYIGKKHANIDISWKLYCTLLLKNLYRKINNELEIYNTIDKFIDFINNEYRNHLSDSDFSLSDFDRDYAFVKQFLNMYEINTSIKLLEEEIIPITPDIIPDTITLDETDLNETIPQD